MKQPIGQSGSANQGEGEGMKKAVASLSSQSRQSSMQEIIPEEPDSESTSIDQSRAVTNENKAAEKPLVAEEGKEGDKKQDVVVAFQEKKEGGEKKESEEKKEGDKEKKSEEEKKDKERPTALPDLGSDVSPQLSAPPSPSARADVPAGGSSPHSDTSSVTGQGAEDDASAAASQAQLEQDIEAHRLELQVRERMVIGELRGRIAIGELRRGHIHWWT